MPSGDEPLSGFVDAALVEGLQDEGQVARVWNGQLVACGARETDGVSERRCVSAGPVDTLIYDYEQVELNLIHAHVVPSDRPDREEIWLIRPFASPPDVQVVARVRRRDQSAAETPFGQEITRGAVLTSWPVTTIAYTDEMARLARAHPAGTEGRAASIRRHDARVIFFRHAHAITTSVVVVKKDDGRTYRSCLIDAESVGYRSLEGLTDLAPLGADIGAIGARVRRESQGYSYDLGYTIELWSLIPMEDGGLSVSAILLAAWNGENPNDDGPNRFEYRGFERRFHATGPRSATLSVPIWREASALDGFPSHARVRRVSRPSCSRLAPTPIVHAFDALGFVPPAPAPVPEPPRESDE